MRVTIDLADECLVLSDGQKCSFYAIEQMMNEEPGTLTESLGKRNGVAVFKRYPAGSIVLTSEQKIKTLGELLGS